MDDATRARIAALLAAARAERDTLLNQAHYQAGRADALEALLAEAAPPPEPPAAPPIRPGPD